MAMQASLTEPCRMPAMFSSASRRWPTSSRSAAPLAFGIRTASRPGLTTAARSSAVSPVSSALTRTKQDQARPALSSIRLATRARAAALLGGATESSRSRISASAPQSRARANLRSESPGTKRSERSLMAKVHAYVRRAAPRARSPGAVAPAFHPSPNDLVGEGGVGRGATGAGTSGFARRFG